MKIKFRCEIIVTVGHRCLEDSRFKESTIAFNLKLRNLILKLWK